MMRYLRLGGLLLGALLLVACGGASTGDSAAGSSTSTADASLATNVVAVSVGPGPAGSGNGTFNISYTSVTVCDHGTSHCATIDHVLVDTGSYGLRLFASVLAATDLNVPRVADPDNGANVVAECIPFADGYIWGPLTVIKLQMNGETADGIPVQVMDNDKSFSPPVPTDCTLATGPTSLNSINAFHANGVLGIGLSAEDCGAMCAQCDLSARGCSASNDLYFSCNTQSNSCQAIPVPISSQVPNPVVAFATDNNGVILELNAVGSAGANTGTGTLTFGIGTQENNALGSAVVLQTDGYGFITAIFNGRTLTRSFFDSGSNGLYFDDSSLQTCTVNAQFYCPPSTVTLQAELQGAQGSTASLSFEIADLSTIPASHYAISNVGGRAAVTNGTDTLSNDFDFGLPFFYGRRVFTAIAGTSAGTNTGPFLAY
jgi:hypothetical protein